jgi:hypothetical protein
MFQSRASVLLRPFKICTHIVVIDLALPCFMYNKARVRIEIGIEIKSRTRIRIGINTLPIRKTGHACGTLQILRQPKLGGSRSYQCWGSVTFWCRSGSGSPDLYL